MATAPAQILRYDDATRSHRSDATFSRNLGYTCLALTTLTGAAYLLSRRKPSGRS